MNYCIQDKGNKHKPVYGSRKVAPSAKAHSATITFYTKISKKVKNNIPICHKFNKKRAALLLNTALL